MGAALEIIAVVNWFGSGSYASCPFVCTAHLVVSTYDDNKASVFESGYSTSDGGAGLGLSIVRQLSEANGWDTSVADADNGGARFEFTRVRTE
ncbi:sensor histidine kinase [Halorussus halophilus]|uniref:sensor histidine kinase n=1 Tax=Halorussus halophilus TaxID=2650975 RepID=UPI0017885E63|nr:ATP-binding protein [Halorussus halophilus]